MGERSNLLASDADREHIAERLRTALTEGRLTHDEFEGRLHDALSARTYGQLDPLVADLPLAGEGRRSSGAPAPKTNGLAIASLATGVAGFFFLWGIGPLLAVVLGTLARKEIKRSNGTQGGSGLATAGIALGVVGLLIAAAFILSIAVAHHFVVSSPR